MEATGPAAYLPETPAGSGSTRRFTGTDGPASRTSRARDDGLKLTDCYITAAARCAPPDNRPTSEELERCRPYLEEELRFLLRCRVVLGLGRIGWESWLRAAGWWARLPPRERPGSRHGAEARSPGWHSADRLVSSQPAEHQHGAAHPPHVEWCLRADQDDCAFRPPTTRFTVCPAGITVDGPSSSLMIASCSMGTDEGYWALNCSSVI